MSFLSSGANSATQGEALHLAGPCRPVISVRALQEIGQATFKAMVSLAR